MKKINNYLGKAKLGYIDTTCSHCLCKFKIVIKSNPHTIEKHFWEDYECPECKMAGLSIYATIDPIVAVIK